jgi:CRISPR/Cas system endoribonuclease Cas6 (RAMP superfamily)
MEFSGLFKSSSYDRVKYKHDETHWWQAERWSSRQQKRLDVSGLVGRVTFSGLDNFAWGLLRIGEHLHVGKNTTCGLGKYQIL